MRERESYSFILFLLLLQQILAPGLNLAPSLPSPLFFDVNNRNATKTSFSPSHLPLISATFKKLLLFSFFELCRGASLSLPLPSLSFPHSLSIYLLHTHSLYISLSLSHWMWMWQYASNFHKIITIDHRFLRKITHIDIFILAETTKVSDDASD